MSTVVALHLGSLHPVEQLLTLALAFGPFLVLGIVVVLRRCADDGADDDADDRAADLAEPEAQRER